MSAKELRKQAETLADCCTDNKLWASQFDLVCHHILATVREDDDEEVTREWFEQVFGDPLDIQTIEPWFIWWHSTRGLLMGSEGGSVGPDPLTLPTKTRGQFRSLCRGLGIELQENAE